MCRFLLTDIRRGRHVVFKSLLLACLLAVLAVHIAVTIQGAALPLTRNYNIYDAAHSAAARWWMPPKVEAGAGVAAEYAPRGSPGRWQLPDDNSGNVQWGPRASCWPQATAVGLC